MCFHVKLIWTKQSQNNYEKDLLFSSWQFGNFFLLPLSLNFLMIWSHPLICISRDLLTQNSTCWEDWIKKFNLQNSSGETERLYGLARSPNLSFWRQRRHRHVLKPLSSMGVAHLPTFGFFMVHGCYGKYSAQFIWFDVLVFVYVHPRYFRFSSWQVEGLCLGAPAFFRCLKHFRNQKLCAKKLEIRFK